MTRMWSMNPLAAAALALTACLGAEPDPDESGEEGEVEEVEYLFGLSEDELLSVDQEIRGEHDDASWLALNRAPFRCASYGDLCAMVGEQAAQDITRLALERALDGADLETIVAETDRATAAALELRVSQPERGALRSSTTGTIEYDCGNHRLRTETFKVAPVIGARYGQVNCKHQSDLGSGVWGGTPSAEMTAFVEVVESGADADASQNTHSLTSPKVYPGRDDTVRGKCTGTHDGETLFRTISED